MPLSGLFLTLTWQVAAKWNSPRWTVDEGEARVEPNSVATASLATGPRKCDVEADPTTLRLAAR
jgi:hypothetical protein